MSTTQPDNPIKFRRPEWLDVTIGGETVIGWRLTSGNFGWRYQIFTDHSMFTTKLDGTIVSGTNGTITINWR